MTNWHVLNATDSKGDYAYYNRHGAGEPADELDGLKLRKAEKVCREMYDQVTVVSTPVIICRNTEDTNDEHDKTT